MWPLIFSLIWFLVKPTIVQANVVINEVHPNPLSGPEWVEIYNPDAESYELTGWTIEDQLSSSTVAYTFGASTIQPGQFLVAELPSTKLNNTSDGATLKNSQGQIIDQMSYTSTTAGQSWSRSPDGSGTFQLSQPTFNSANTPPTSPTPQPSASPVPEPSTTPSSTPSPSPIPSPTASPTSSPSPTASPSPSPITYPTHFQPSEIVACAPEGETEWLEIFNPSATAYTLENWIVKDTAGNSRLVSTTIAAQSWGVLTWTGSLLNNTGDTVNLLTPNTQLVFSVSLGACQTGRSFVISNNQWVETVHPTKGLANIISNPSPSSSPNAAGEENESNVGGTKTASPSSSLSFPNLFPPNSPNPLKLPFNLPFFTASNSGQVLGLTTTATTTSAETQPQEPRRPNAKMGFLSVIMGALLVITPSSYRLYERYLEICPTLA